MALISAFSSYSALIGIHISTGFLAGYVLCRKYRALILHHDRRQHYKLTSGFLATLQIFCAVLIILNFLLWSEATLKEAAVIWFCTALLFLIGACAGFIHSGVVVVCGDVNTETSKTLRLNKVRQPKSRGKKKELGRDEEKREAGSSEDEVPPQEVQKGKHISDREFKKPTSVLQQQRKYATDKSTRNTTNRQSSLQDTQTRHRPKRKDEKRGKNDLTATGDDDMVAEGYSSGYKSESSEDPEENMIPASGDGNTRTEFPPSPRSPTYITARFPNEDRITDMGAGRKTKKKNDTLVIRSVYKSGSNKHSDTLDNMIPAYGSGNTRTEFRHSPRSPYITAGFSNENRITDRGTKSKTKKKKKNDTIAIYDKVAIVLSSVYKSGSSEHSEELDHSTGASYVASASYHRGPRTKRNQIIGKEPPHLSSQRKPKTDNKWKKLPAKESQNQLIHSPHKSLGQRGSTSLLTPEEQNERNEEEEASRYYDIGRNIGRNYDDVLKPLDASSSGRTETSIETLKPEELLLRKNIKIQHQVNHVKGLHQAHLEARRLAEEARRLAEEEARRLAEEARRLAEEEARRLAEEEARQLAEERARRLAAEEAARWLAEQQAARRLAEEKAAKLEQEKAAKLAEEKAAKLAQERAAKLAEEKTTNLAEEEVIICLPQEDEDEVRRAEQIEMSTEPSSVGESPVGESPVKESLVGESPVKESPVGESPVGGEEQEEEEEIAKIDDDSQEKSRLRQEQKDETTIGKGKEEAIKQGDYVYTSEDDANIQQKVEASLPHGEKKTQLVTDPDKQQEESHQEPKEDLKETQGDRDEGSITGEDEKVDVKVGDDVPNVPVVLEEHKDAVGQDIERKKDEGRITGKEEKLDVKVGGDVPSGYGTSVEVEEQKDAKEKEMVRFDEKAEIFHEKEQKWDKLGIGNIVILLDEKQKYEIKMRDKENDTIIASHPVRKETQLVPAKGTDRSYVWTTEALLGDAKKEKKTTFFVRFKDSNTASLFQEEFQKAQSPEKRHEEMVKGKKKTEKGGEEDASSIGSRDSGGRRFSFTSRGSGSSKDTRRDSSSTVSSVLEEVGSKQEEKDPNRLTEKDTKVADAAKHGEKKGISSYIDLVKPVKGFFSPPRKKIQEKPSDDETEIAGTEPKTKLIPESKDMIASAAGAEKIKFDQGAEIFLEKGNEWNKLCTGNIVILLDEKQKYEINMIDKENNTIIASHPVRKETQLVPAKGTDRSYVWTTEALVRDAKKEKKTTFFVRFKDSNTASLFQEEFQKAQSPEKQHEEMVKGKDKQNTGMI